LRFNQKDLKLYNHYEAQIETLSTLSQKIFQELLNDNLVMERLQLPLSSDNENIKDLLITWSKNIHQMALDSVLLKKNAQWFVTWSINLESRLNNYKCAAYMLLEKTIKITFQQVQGRQYHDQLFPNCTESWTISEKIIDLEPAKASKFHDTSILAYKEFAKIKSCLDALSSEHLFEKHIEYGPDILIYINNNLVNNQPLKKQFNNLLQVAYELHYKSLPEFTNDYIQLSKEAEDYLLVRLIKTYMRSRQRSWRRFKEYISEKGLSSLRENVKAMNADLKSDAKKDEKSKIKLVTFKKGMLPEDLDLALCQLKIWTRDNRAKSVFEKVFMISDLKILVQAFQSEP
ncbi:14973_t:CDS:2, partial [Racocetra persica]